MNLQQRNSLVSRLLLLLAAAFALLCVTAQNVIAQTVEIHVAAAERAESARDFKAAAIHYDSAFKVSGFDPVLLAVSGATSARGGQFGRAVSRIREAMKAGFVDEGFFNHLRRDSTLKPLRRRAEWKSLNEDIDKHLESIDTTLRNELFLLEREDQSVRSEIDALIRRYGPKSPQADSAWKVIGSSDAPRIRRIIEIVETSGWPGNNRVGDEAAHAAWLVIQHADSAIQVRLFPLIEKAASRGVARKADVAMLEDRIRIARGQLQRYGSQLTWPDSGAAPTVKPLEQPECVDARRATVGLEPLKYNAQRFGADFDVPQRKRC